MFTTPRRRLMVLSACLILAMAWTVLAADPWGGDGAPADDGSVSVAGQAAADSTGAGLPASPSETPSSEPSPTPSAPPTPSASPTPSATPTPTPTPAPPRTATIAFTGDLLPHQPVMNAAAANAAEGWDFRPMFDEVRPILAGVDLAICHLESPISPDDRDLGTFPVFNAPRALVAAAVDAGYDGCSTASNHSFDRRVAGVHSTLDVFDAMGLRQAGTARTAEEDVAPVLYEVNGITIGHVAATYSLNGFVLPADQPWLVDLIDPAEVIREAGLARAAGAEFVVVSLHWGNEYQHVPSVQQEQWLAEILPSDEVDLVIGHHAHVVQPIDRVGDEWVVFGLGNFLSNQSGDCCTVATQDGMIATVTLREDEAGGIAVAGIVATPTWVDRADGYVIRVASGQPARPELAGVLADSDARTREVVGSRLGTADGLTFGPP